MTLRQGTVFFFSKISIHVEYVKNVLNAIFEYDILKLSNTHKYYTISFLL